MSARGANRNRNRNNATTSTSTPSSTPRGRGRGSFHSPHLRGPDTSRIPPISSLLPGTAVSIVLKADQGTSREVQGYIQDLLTRGDHPRGVKVRLRDGRVGRVQRVCGEGDVDEVARSGRVVGENGGSVGERRTGGGERRVWGSERGLGGEMGSRYEGPGGGDEEEEDGPELSLADYVVIDKRKKAAKIQKPGNENSREIVEEGWEVGAVIGGEEGLEAKGSATVTCPVCGEFKGDEAAVAFHVDSHFG